MIGGRSLIAWQADLALRLGCERVVCLARGLVPELIELQREIEARGRQFQIIRGPLQLVGLTSADNELLVLADGLVIDPELADSIVGKGRGVAALPADEGIAAGFERIDADRSWGGILVARGQIVERLADMPPDIDTVSLLLRLALQAGTQVVLLEKQKLASGELILAKGEAALEKRETALLDRAAQSNPWTAPGLALANRLARRFSPKGLDRGPIAGLVAGGIAGLAAIGLAATDYPFPALILVALASFSLRLSAAFKALASRLRGIGGSSKHLFWNNALVDVLLTVVLVLPTTAPMIPRRLFLPLILIGLLRLGARHPNRRISALFSDRILLALVLAPAAWFGVLTQAMAVLSLLILAVLLGSGRQSQITGG
ncbi:hypothetical protein P7228_14235 [Altererythrobacter arenosus]|uniref:Uncharacterized protein n=1 Tax=Altererythrobacter arenosus TaxID=3032592 RepID=A0ABY8FQK5_9SPHN|nr:hypothetical protein [Altererythrobacter sp. CAU 1644]WFL77132.1 hypothetical protein P7228_14235 [Altererythrobacter sp. CAU 1644]